MKFGKSVWHSSRKEIINAEVSKYDAPVEIVTRPNYFTIMPTTTRGFLEILKYGETIQNYWTVIANGCAFDGKIKVGDVMWVDGEKPIEELEELYGIGTTANAIVENVAEVNHTISITLRRNQNQLLK